MAETLVAIRSGIHRIFALHPLVLARVAITHTMHGFTIIIVTALPITDYLDFPLMDAWRAGSLGSGCMLSLVVPCLWPVRLASLGGLVDHVCLI